MREPEGELKVLIVAQNASTRFGGEALLPVKYFELLRRRGHPAKLIAHQRNYEDLLAVLKPYFEDIVFIEDTAWHRAIWRMGNVFPRRIRDVVFGNLLNYVNERHQARVIQSFVREGAADVIHQPIPVSPRYPSSIHGFGRPVVVGPMNGGMTFPPGYADFESAGERAFVQVFRAASVVVNWLIPGKRRAATLLVANERTRRALPVGKPRRVVTLVENGVDLSLWRAEGAVEDRAPGVFRLVFMGRLVRWKAVDITLQALALAQAAGIVVELDVLGDGEDRTRLEAASAKLGLGSVVRFAGFRSQAECVPLLRAADALILNSLYECGGAVVLEAMSLGLPVIASDWGGPADYLDAACGMLVPPVPRESFAARLSEAIVQLARDPARRQEMGRAGAAKVRREFDWEKKVDVILSIYREAVESDRRTKARRALTA